MNRSDENSSCSEKLYIDPERYKAQKEIMKSRGRDCRDDTIREKIFVGLRQFQNYISGKRPVPGDKLIDLCRYLDTSPDWLTGQTDSYTYSFEASTEEYRAFSLDFEKDRLLMEYLRQAGIMKGEHTFHGVDLSQKEYRALLETMKAAVELSAKQFTENITFLRS